MGQRVKDERRADRRCARRHVNAGGAPFGRDFDGASRQAVAVYRKFERAGRDRSGGRDRTRSRTCAERRLLRRGRLAVRPVAVRRPRARSRPDRRGRQRGLFVLERESHRRLARSGIVDRRQLPVLALRNRGMMGQKKRALVILRKFAVADQERLRNRRRR